MQNEHFVFLSLFLKETKDVVIIVLLPCVDSAHCLFLLVLQIGCKTSKDRVIVI